MAKPFRPIAQQRQAEFRARSGTISDAARLHNGHTFILAPGYEEENLYPGLRGKGGAKDFFLDRGIQWWGSTPRVQPPRATAELGPTGNMTSSQVAAVNFLLPLADRPEILLAMMRGLDPALTSIEPLTYVGLDGGEITSYVEFEWIGLGRTLEGNVGKRGRMDTSADTLIVGTTSAGGRRAYLMEWKYAESYRTDHSLLNETRRSRYEALYGADDSCFSAVAPLNELLYDPIYQIMRMGLLGDLMVRRREFGATDARVVVVCPEENIRFRTTITSPGLRERFSTTGPRSLGAVCRQLWKDPNCFIMTSPAHLMDGLRQVNVPPALELWRAYVEARYT